MTFTALWWQKLLGEEGRLLLVSLPPLISSTLFPRLQPSPYQEQRLLFFFFFRWKRSRVLFILLKKNPWNSSWPFLKYNKEAGLLTTGRAALTYWRSGSTSAWGGEEAAESTRAGSTEHGSCLQQTHQPRSPPWVGSLWKLRCAVEMAKTWCPECLP